MAELVGPPGRLHGGLHPMVRLFAPLTALERALRTAHAELADQATARRRDADALAATWTGGHRERFDDDVGEPFGQRVHRVEQRLDGLRVMDVAFGDISRHDPENEGL